IAVLLAAARVASRRLKVAALARADPHVGPCRRNRELPDAREGPLVGYPFALSIDEFKCVSARDPHDPGRSIRDVAKAARARGEELLLVEGHGAGRDTRPKKPQTTISSAAVALGVHPASRRSSRCRPPRPSEA